MRIILALALAAAAGSLQGAAATGGAPAAADPFLAGRIDEPVGARDGTLAAPRRGATGNPLWAIPLAALAHTRDRPLFSPSRRPATLAVVAPLPPASAPPVAKAPDHPRIDLIGTIVGEARQVAVFLDVEAHAVIRLRLGEQHDGWTLRRIGRREVTLDKGNEAAALVLASSGAREMPRIGPLQDPPAHDRPDAITRFANALPAPDVAADRRCPQGSTGGVGPSGNSLLCALGHSRASMRPQR
jgi:general secretion pathway protein N